MEMDLVEQFCEGFEADETIFLRCWMVGCCFDVGEYFAEVQRIE